MRDGQPALVSRQKNSLVLVRPASRQLRTNGRPVFVVGINNLGKQPVDFVVNQVEAMQHVAGSDYEMKIVTYEMLVQEEKNRQVAAAILTGGCCGRERLQCISGRVWALHDAKRSYRHVLQPDGCRDRSEQCGCPERGYGRCDGRDWSAQYGCARAIRHQGQYLDAE